MSARDVLSDRVGIADVRWALLGAAPKRAIRGVIQSLLERGAVLRTCRLRRAKFKPGRKLTVHYDACVRTRGTDNCDIIRSVVAVWNNEAGDVPGDPDTARLEAEAVDAGFAAPFRLLFARLPELQVSFKVSPLDPKLPQLLRLCDPGHVAAILKDAMGETRCSGYRVSTVRYRPGERHVLRYDPARTAPVDP